MEFIKKIIFSYYLWRFRLPRDVILFALEKNPNRPALTGPRGTLTFDQLRQRIGALCGLWRRLGVRKGDILITQLQDGWEQVEVRLAALCFGLVQTSVGASGRVEEIRLVLEESVPRVFIHDPTFGGMAEQIRARYPGTVLLSTGVQGNYEPGLAESSAEIAEADLTLDEVCAVGGTSGTTGPPKILATTYRMIMKSLGLLAANVSPGRPGRDVYLSGIPLSGAGSGMVFPWLATRSLLVVTPRHDTPTVLDLARLHRASILFLTPSQLIDLLDFPTFTREDLPALREIIYGTAPMPVAKLEEAIRRLGPIFRQGYGMAEVLPPISFLSPAEHGIRNRPASREILSSVGRVVRGVQVRIETEPGRLAARGEPGMVWVKSPTLFAGYWHRSDLNTGLFKEGFLRTGDYGFMDFGDRLHILGREQDLLLEGGRPVSPRYPEEAAHDHPAVKEACLVERPGSPERVLCVSFRRAWRDRPDRAALLKEVLAMVQNRAESGKGRPDSARLFEELPPKPFGQSGSAGRAGSSVRWKFLRIMSMKRLRGHP